jgi:GTP-binding protein
VKILRADFAGACHVPGRYPPPTLPEIAFAGRSNVGKSSLLNTLLHRKRLAHTSRTPGRTQAIQFYRVNERFLFVDLPGYGYARAPEALRRAWRPLVEGYLEGRSSLRAVVVILDIRHDPAEGDVELLDYLAHHAIPAIVVLSKADKLPRGRQAAQALAIARSLSAGPGAPAVEPIPFSAVTGQGLDALWRAIRGRLAA